MSKKEVTALLQQTRPQVLNPNDMIPANAPSVKDCSPDLRTLRISAGITARDMIEVVQTIYPKYDKIIQSKCEHGDEYGIQLRPDAMKALLARFAPEPRKSAPQPRRSKPNRIQARLDDGLYARLQLAVKRDGITIQQFIEQKVQEYLAQHDHLKGDLNHDQTAQ